ncbi:MAG: protein kinase [Alphaproteobacteria bacterium]|nr:protein kinase [Alphaproteobacteria bacterium]
MPGVDHWLLKRLRAGGGDDEEFKSPHNQGEGAEPESVGDTITGRFRYELVDKLGAGAFGAVYRARCLDADGSDERPPPEVAIKILKLSGDRGQIQSIRQELASLLAIRSPHIPRVYDWSLDARRGFVAMGLYKGGTLRDHLAQVGAYTEEQAWRLLKDLLGALRDAHSASVLHMDIKPSNVLLKANGGYVLTDFGISQGAQTSGGLQSVGMGTPYYYAPEQRWGRRHQFDMRTDLYGVGATVWSAYTCVNLASRRAKSIVAKTEDETWGLPRPTTFRTFTSTQLENVLMGLLVQDPHRRPGSAAEVLSQIERIHDPTVAAAIPGRELSPQEAEPIVANLIDPLWSHLFQNERRGLRMLDDGEYLCRVNDRSYYTYVLLRGAVEVVINDKVVFVEDREGTFLGEVSALTGKRRTATLRARGPVVLRVMNASQLERFVTRNPAIGVRLIRSMAERLDRSG